MADAGAQLPVSMRRQELCRCGHDQGIEEPGCHIIPLFPPVAAALVHPLPQHVPGLEPHIVRDALEDPRMHVVVLQPPLPHVRHLVVQNPGHLVHEVVAGDATDEVDVELDRATAGGGDVVRVTNGEGDGVALGVPASEGYDWLKMP